MVPLYERIALEHGLGKLSNATSYFQVENEDDGYEHADACKADIFHGCLLYTSYTDDYYEAGGYGDDGIIYCIDMDAREYHVGTYGKVIDVMTDSRLEDLTDAAASYLSKGNYQKAFDTFLSRTESYMKKGAPDGAYREDEATGERTKPINRLTTAETLVSILVGLGVAAIFCGGAAASYKIKLKNNGFNFRAHSRLDLRERNDVLVNSFVTTRHIQQNSSSGGSSGSSHRSTTHRTSSGRSAGGRSGKF